MKKLARFLIFLTQTSFGQTIEVCRNTFTDYLNFKGQLNSVVKFEKDFISISSESQRKVLFYTSELEALKRFFEHTSYEQQLQLIEKKGSRRFNTSQLDSLMKLVAIKRSGTNLDTLLPLKGVKIALDPGHFATNLKEAAYEQKYLHFSKPNASGRQDTVLIFESLLAYQTAFVLKKMFQEKGAEVFMTRDSSNYTSFNCRYSDWLKNDKKLVLDSLYRLGKLNAQKHMQLMKANPHEVFWNFFRDFDLSNRAQKINQFGADVTLIIHFNVDEKNAPWNKTSSKNFTMAFIGGAFVPSDLQKNESLTHFSRLLLGSQLKNSERLAALTVTNFNQYLQIPLAKPYDADYLLKNCISLKSTGVFCRNLLMCRKVNSVLVYGESLYQDNEKEAMLLMKKDVAVGGILVSSRIEAVIKSYYEAVMQFYKNN